VHWQHSHLQNSSLQQAYAEWAHFNDADLSFSSLSDADLSHADLTSASLSHATAKNLKLTGALLRDTDLELADLRHADFTDAIAVREVANWTDANLADAIGLSPADQSYAVSHGAVLISDDLRWNAYKQSGRPHANWSSFAKP
jgi:uncharacterized protein YjbI with pentapeptide repeats